MKKKVAPPSAMGIAQKTRAQANRIARERMLDNAVPEGGIHAGTKITHDPRGFGRYPSGGKRPARYATVEISPDSGGLIRDPATEFSRAFRAAMNAPPPGLVIIYDAGGKAIATMDPVTRLRKPL